MYRLADGRIRSAKERSPGLGITAGYVVTAAEVRSNPQDKKEEKGRWRSIMLYIVITIVML